MWVKRIARKCFNPTLRGLATFTLRTRAPILHRRLLSLPLWDDWALQVYEKVNYEVEDRRFNPTLGRLGTSRIWKAAVAGVVYGFQSHSGTIGHFKRIGAGTVKFYLWGFNPTLGRLGTSSVHLLGLFVEWRIVSIPLWDDWALQANAPMSSLRRGHRFNPTLGRLGTSSGRLSRTSSRPGLAFNPTLGRLGTSSCDPCS